MSAWKPDGTGVMSGGDIGGDFQVGDSYSVRYHHAREPGAVVNVAYYVSGQRGSYNVSRQVEWIVCTDRRQPGDTEVWSDYADDIAEYGIESLAEAENAAQRYARGHRAADVTWNGKRK